MNSSFRQRHHGIALVIALVFLVLLSALIVAFFTNVETEMQAAKSYESSTTSGQLISSVTNLVSGQIVDATRSMKTPVTGGAVPAATIPPGERLTWASQPGMIRTWDDTGAGWKIFKLYSDPNMVVGFDPDGSYSTGNRRKTELPEDWPAQTALFTDLNEPVLVEDPAGGIVKDGQGFRAGYPIVDPLAMLPTAQTAPVDGFSITTPPGYAGSLGGGGSPVFTANSDPTEPASGKTHNPAPMPVRWIYLLKDGTLTVPTGSADNGRTATWSSASAAFQPSKTNPIVGRVAFWTDDETSKLNLNTASEPTPWDTPRAVTVQDLKYGKNQPAPREYQRFPGHPFMTALSPVLFPGATLTTTQKEAIYDAIPRVQRGGSIAGTVSIDSTTSPITPDADRLFANPDEFLFEPTNRKTLLEDSRFDSLHFDAARLRSSRFFLTASSRAPEVNLYGQPRIALWPVSKTESNRTAHDKLAAFCSTIGSVAGGTAYPFYFQRSNAASPTADWTDIARNQDIFSYLQRLTGAPVPGFGGTFLAKWQADRNQVLTEIVDYIRCTNLWDSQPGATKYSLNGQVAPLQILRDQTGALIDTQGFGRFHTISQFILHFICSQQGAAGLSTLGLSPPQPALGQGERAIEAALYLEPFSVALGYTRITEQIFYEVTFKTPLSVDGQDLGFPTTTINAGVQGTIKAVVHGEGRDRGGAGGIRGPILGMGGANYPVVGKARPRVVVGKNGRTTMTLSGCTVEVKVHAGTSAGSPLIQTFTVQIPAGDVPVPDLVMTGTDPSRSGGGSANSYWWTLQSRLGVTNGTPYLPSEIEYPTHPERTWGNDLQNFPPGFKLGSVIRKEDVVRALVPNHGDIRLIAARRTVDATRFGPVGDWSSPEKIQHVISEAAGTHFMYGNANEPGFTSQPGDQLIPSANINYHWSRLPEIKPGAGRIYNRWNDFDNGVSMWTDGSYINKPDEGKKAIGQGYNYFDWNWDTNDTSNVIFSPNRLVPSAGMFGSLPTGVKRHVENSSSPDQMHAWETLLFRPEANHPGQAAGFPKDHLLMDLFWMPVIEPYAMSEPFSTAGKINLNYEIAPFDYIRRATGLYGAMKSEEPLLLPNEVAKVYKLWDHEVNDYAIMPNDNRTKDAQVRADWDKLFNGAAPFDKLRRPIDMEQTLSQFETRFKSGEIFRTASQLCELHLVRQGETLGDYQSGAVRSRNLLTGDNTRERPYTNLCARLTTRSNSYTIHLRVQVLHQVTKSTPVDWTRWQEGTDVVLSEYRGSTLVERYIDPADPNLVDFAKDANAVVDNAYKMRVVASKKFTP